MNLLKKCLFLSALFIPFSGQANSYAELSCEEIFQKLETGELTDSSLYDKCGFLNEDLVWNKWAGYVSEKKMRRAIYEICIRFPLHEYHELYCDKAIQMEYPPALVYAGEKAINKGDFQTGYNYLTRALSTQQLTNKEEGKVLEILGVHYLKTADPKAAAYIDKASQKESALANNLLGINYYIRKDEDLANEEILLEYFWRAILLGCKKAEENVGLVHLTKQGKITYERALAEMKKNMYSCEATQLEKSTSKDRELYSCRCKFAIDMDKRQSDRDYILRRTEAKMAVLEDRQGETVSVTEGRVLPNKARVSEVRRTAVILTYPTGEREILNLYKKDPCVDFCKQNGIYENLSVEDMRLRIDGAKEVVKIKPYHLTFTPQECAFVEHYAKLLFPNKETYVGKEECLNQEIEVDPVLSRISEPEFDMDMMKQNERSKQSEKTLSTLSEHKKNELRKSAESILK
ncbi:MAG: hypothetical protein IJY92_03185 [Alphaproteobacteria bacterium]|nr:hypothetical protein [Alphaproteobacteria bacterium]